MDMIVSKEYFVKVGDLYYAGKERNAVVNFSDKLDNAMPYTNRQNAESTQRIIANNYKLPAVLVVRITELKEL